MRGADFLSLAEWRRTTAELYAAIRADDDPRRAWERWHRTRRELFVAHPQSPIPREHRAAYLGPHVFPYDPAARVLATTEALDPAPIEVSTSDGQRTRMVRAMRASFTIHGRPATLDLSWIDQYGGGLYLAFRDTTSGGTTYGGGRYLLDSIKGADLGMAGRALVLDFNFAYQPSCSYDPRWSCPLPPAENTLGLPIEAGERMAADDR